MPAYIVGGNVMVDTVHFQDGRSNRDQLGGPSVFAFSGVKLWTDDCRLVCNVGLDFDRYFDSWIAHNGVDRSGIKYKTDRCNHSHLFYAADGSYGQGPQVDLRVRMYSSEQMGYMKTSPEELGEHTGKGGVKGVYMAQNCDGLWWDRLGAIKARDGFKMMWEIEGSISEASEIERILHAMRYVDVFSCNNSEAARMFETEKEEELLCHLAALPVPMTLFRVGARGLYTIADGRWYFHPSVVFDSETDPTGCGNASTGGALWAYCENPDPIYVGTVANVTAAQNIRQYGVIPDFAAVRAESEERVRELVANYKHGD